MFARKDDQVEIALEGEGWIYLGNQSTVPGLEFLAREEGRGRTLFRFRAGRLGEGILEFQLQDLARGGLKSERVRLRVLPDAEFLARVSAARQERSPAAPAAPAPAPIPAADGGEPTAGPAGDGRFVLADRLYGYRQYDAALEEYLRGYGEGGPFLDDRIASIYLQLGRYEAAARYYQKNRQAGLLAARNTTAARLDTAAGEFGQKAVLGLMRCALGAGDSRQVIALLDDFLALDSLPIEADLLEASRRLLDWNQPGLSWNLLQEYLRRYPEESGRDEAYFLLGRIHEGESDLRDLKKARELYTRVVEEYPESRFGPWAAARVRYLNRYFFYIR